MEGVNISDYALIGNCRTAALVSNKGSIDWCCFPEFHSPSLFASLLDKNKGGYFSIAPINEFTSYQSYINDTNVVETIYETVSGRVRLIDAFTVVSKEAMKNSLIPEHEILRIVEGISGEVKMKSVYFPQPFYGKYRVKLEDRKKLGIHFGWRENIYTLLSTCSVQLCDDKAVSEFTVKGGEQVAFSLCYSNYSPVVLPELQQTSRKRMEDTIDYWKKWIGRCCYKGVYEQLVKRSVLVLKLLAHAPSGAIIAAPTTSLPEELRGVRNWDYRYCWLRDASFAINALIALGFEEEAHAYMNWIIHATRLTRPEVQVVYSVYGHNTLKEQSLNWLGGYKESVPVRIGNGADSQFQLDVYGEVLDAIYCYSKLITEFDKSTRKFVLGLGKVVLDLWDKPDNGIWEVRSGLIHHTHSKVMAWVALDCLIKLSKKYQWKNVALDRYIEVADKIRIAIEASGYNEEIKSYTREFNGKTLDASLLTLSLFGYCDYNSPRMVTTCNAIYSRLTKHNLTYRYLREDDGLTGGEGAFGVCSFWLAQNYAKQGKLEKAITIVETMLRYASPTGLFSEEVDPDTGELLGNYPQSFTHIGLINAVLCINEELLKGET
ncbi:MAG TPA: glycoside hydrolase family 15 protein [Cytophagaceae bacterium]